jgi:hypothetical protein
MHENYFACEDVFHVKPDKIAKRILPCLKLVADEENLCYDQDDVEDARVCDAHGLDVDSKSIKWYSCYFCTHELSITYFECLASHGNISREKPAMLCVHFFC